MAQPIRPLYEQHGTEGYYQAFGDRYENPHLPEIRALLERNRERFDCSGGVLDFAAGGGEVTRVLQGLGVRDIRGSDPFTHRLYEQNTGLACAQWSFRDVVRAGISERYSLIISSFALHLCPAKDLFPLAWNLLQAAPTLVVLTPHKRPALELLPGIALAWEDAVATPRGKLVRLKAYRLAEGSAQAAF
jgi:hypothetical protein